MRYTARGGVRAGGAWCARVLPVLRWWCITYGAVVHRSSIFLGEEQRGLPLATPGALLREPELLQLLLKDRHTETDSKTDVRQEEAFM
jgi:hypothetical protein